MQPASLTAEGGYGLPADEEESAEHSQQVVSSLAGQGKKNLPEQRRRVMSDRFMMFTYKIKMCKREDLHNWRLCPYAHPGEAGKRRPPHAYQAIMCDFSKTRKECSHGEACLLARNALEYWLHPDKYRTIMCGHGEACNRNICFFAHSQQELRTPASRALVPAVDAAADAFQQLQISHHGAGSSNQTGQQQQLIMQQRPRMGVVDLQQQQPLQAVQVVGAGAGQQQVLVQVAADEQQQHIHFAVASGGGTAPAASGLQHLQYSQQPTAVNAGTLQPGLVAAPAVQQPPMMLMQPPGVTFDPGTAQVPFQQGFMYQDAAQQQQQGLAGTSTSRTGEAVLLSQQPMAQRWGSALAGQVQNITHAVNSAAHMPYYSVPDAVLASAEGHLMAPLQQQPQQPQPQQPPQVVMMAHTQHQHQQVYYQPQHPQMLMFAPGNPGPPAALTSGAPSSGPVSYTLVNPGAGQVQVLLSPVGAQGAQLAPAGVQPGGSVVFPASPVGVVEQAGMYGLPIDTAAGEAYAQYGLPARQ